MSSPKGENKISMFAIVMVSVITATVIMIILNLMRCGCRNKHDDRRDHHDHPHGYNPHKEGFDVESGRFLQLQKCGASGNSNQRMLKVHEYGVNFLDFGFGTPLVKGQALAYNEPEPHTLYE